MPTTATNDSEWLKYLAKMLKLASNCEFEHWRRPGSQHPKGVRTGQNEIDESSNEWDSRLTISRLEEAAHCLFSIVSCLQQAVRTAYTKALEI